MEREKGEAEAEDAATSGGLISLLPPTPGHRGHAPYTCQDPSSETVSNSTDAQVIATLEIGALSLSLIIVKILAFGEDIRRVLTEDIVPHFPNGRQMLHGGGAGASYKARSSCTFK